MEAKSESKRRPRRTHALGGCATCRRRHVKCDQVRPACLTCRAVRVACEGFSSDIRWVTSPSTRGTNRSASQHARRHLYSEASRQSMSTAMVAELGSAAAIDASLAELDSKAESGPNPSSITIGPFGILNFTVPNSPPANDDPPDYSTVVNPVEDGFTDNLSAIDSWLNIDDSLQWADLFDTGFENMHGLTSSGIDPVTVDDSYNDVPLLGLQTYDKNFSTQSLGSSVDDTDYSVVEPASGEPSDSSVTEIYASTVLEYAQVLLKHFVDDVIPQISPLPLLSRSPWDILNASSAVNTLAAKTFLKTKDLKHGPVANLYGVLACSAHHLASYSSTKHSQPPEHWSQLAQNAADLGKHHLRQSLRMEFQGPGKAKYKDQLMAITSMVLYSILSGRQGDARCYMIDAERLLRLRGLTKRDLSRKARLLHHVYTWLRIIGESTYVIHDYTSFTPFAEAQPIDQQIRPAESEDGDGTAVLQSSSSRLDDFLRIDRYDPENDDLDIEEPKEAGLSLRDIHLKDSRKNLKTLYMKIFGIHETWLSLVSQTTRLANAIEAAHSCDQPSRASFLKLLDRRASRLEDMICSFASRAAANLRSDSANECINHALNSALVIFFYRRIRYVNPLILQGYVDEVIKSLESCDNAHRGLSSFGGPWMVWPAFVAGCEAITAERRSWLRSWVEKGYEASRLRWFKSALDTMDKVWTRRDEGSANHTSLSVRRDKGRDRRFSESYSSWVTISREENVWLMLY